MVLLLIEFGASIFLKNKHGMLSTDCTKFLHLRNQAVRVASRYDTLIICSCDLKEREFAKHLAFYLTKHHNVSCNFKTSFEFHNEETQSAFAWVIAIVGQSSSCHMGFHSVFDQMEYPVIGVLLESNIDISRFEFVVVYELASFSKEIIRYKQQVHINQSKVESRDPLEGLEVLSRKKFNPSSLQKLLEQCPQPDSTCKIALEDISTCIRSCVRSRMHRVVQKVYESIGNHDFELTRLMREKLPFVIVLNYTGNNSNELDVKVELDKWNIRSWFLAGDVKVSEIIRRGWAARSALVILMGPMSP